MTICVFVICCTLATISSTGVNLVHLFCVRHWNQKHESVDMFICKLLYTIFLQRSLYPAFASNRRHSNHLELYSKCNISSYSELKRWNCVYRWKIDGRYSHRSYGQNNITPNALVRCSFDSFLFQFQFLFAVSHGICVNVCESMSLNRLSHCNVQFHRIGSKWKRAITGCTCLSCKIFCLIISTNPFVIFAHLFCNLCWSLVMNNLQSKW